MTRDGSRTAMERARRAEDVAGVLRAEGVEVQVTADPAPETPDLASAIR